MEDGGKTEQAVLDLMRHVVGFKDVDVTTNEAPVALAHFHTPMQAMKFIWVPQKKRGNACS